MGAKKSTVDETPQQRAMSEHALNQWADWKQRWLPVQQNLSKQITSMGKEGSIERERATGRAAADVDTQFQRAQGALEKSLSNTGAQVGSSKFNLGVSALKSDQAKSRGLNMTSADQSIDQAYVEGLQALTSIGRGERAQVNDSMGGLARNSSRQAVADAESSLSQRASNAQIIGQGVGFGVQQSLGKMTPDSGFGSVPGGYEYGGVRYNNPSAYIAGRSMATNLFGVNTGSKTYAGDTFAALTREQWADYVSQFVPLENQLIQYATDPGVVTQSMQKASTNVNQSFDAAEASAQRRLKGYGVTLTPEEQAAQKREFGLARSLADVQAQGLARDLTTTRQRSVLGNPAPQAGANIAGVS